MISSASMNQYYNFRKSVSPDNTSPEWVAGQAYLASRDERYRPRDDSERALAKAENLIAEGRDFVSARDAGNARLCYTFAARLARQVGSKDLRKELLELDYAISGLNQR